MGSLADKLYAITDKGPVRALSLVLALVVAGCVFWDPSRFAARTSAFEVWQGILLIWAVCAGVVHGFGFRPQRAFWRAFFAPLPAIVILIAGLLYVTL
ncbi:cyd operon protein YbgE [Gibbsiella quercinecans]|uniref:Cytochrome bd biosynthesis protein n=1 Tax=Gibbsiella quercinecans TaxID=929813 RepID=A0A250AXX3_9GAMM|nr:cyd operon protein YbgE [Gibbsiella quercinecans]ATA18820.1 cytochrome bd biosynthesis protein [Gibbsiella quercinecans]RLM12034.1 cyd operon protein YbgE [Gibbsiella quercinecans]RLM15069.1 cyd operon protein YbgE [Gibbsiella quercinecans]RLM15951.1 cyd operon protein YbgE [Gibbsiella quercinecans]TCT91645.1 cyd operon protein YbgE [Gibbsiella quercinecans]